MVITEQIQVKINWLKKSLSYACVFCGYKMSERYRGRVLMDLPICSLCLDRYNMIRNKDITLRQKQFLNNWFAGKCYLCERTVVGCSSQKDVKEELKKTDQGFKLCQSACYQRFKMISGWQDKNTQVEEQIKPIKSMTGMGVGSNNSYSSYSEALKVLQSARQTGSLFLFNDLEKRSKR